tara:strand:- start:134 stop:1312 length:1179 start_codon:yes stop_codon:yes gene_type:complete
MKAENKNTSDSSHRDKTSRPDYLHTDKTSSPGEVSRAYSLFYGFFMLPAMIAAGGFVLMYFFTFITTEDKMSPASLLATIDGGSQSNQWQSAVYLTKLIKEDEYGNAYFEDYVGNPDKFNSFKIELSRIYKKSKSNLVECDEDSWKKRYYLANTMGRLKDSFFIEDLIDGVDDVYCNDELENANKNSSKIMAISSLGQIEYNDIEEKLKVVEKLKNIILDIDNSSSLNENQILEVSILTTLGEIGYTELSENLLKVIVEQNTWYELKQKKEIIPQNLKWNASLSSLKVFNDKVQLLKSSNAYTEDNIVLVVNDYHYILDDIKGLLTREYYNDYRDIFDFAGEEDHTILNILKELQYSEPIYIQQFVLELERLKDDQNIQINIIATDILSKIY